MKNTILALIAFLFLIVIGSCSKNNGNGAACFNTDIATPLINQLITFTDCSDNSVTAAWDFGDGSVGTGTIVKKLYNTAGTYKITMITTNSRGEKNTLVKTIIVYALPSANFNFNYCFNGGGSAKSILADDTVMFSPNQYNVGTYTWDFGDGTISHDSVTKHIFSSLGTFNIKLVVRNIAGVDSSVQTVQVASPFSGNFIQYSSMGGNNSTFLSGATSLSAGSTFIMQQFPSHYSDATATITLGRKFSINSQQCTVGYQQGTYIYGNVHGHGELTGDCNNGTLYVVDTISVGTTVNVYYDTLRRQ